MRLPLHSRSKRDFSWKTAMSLMMSLSLHNQTNELIIVLFVLIVMNLGNITSKPKSASLTIGQVDLTSCIR